MKDKGPVFVTAFSPLSMVIVAVLSSFILAEQMFLGRYSSSSLFHHNHTTTKQTKKLMPYIYRIIGAIVIVAGLYFVMWGKSNDHKSGSPSTDGQMDQDKQMRDTGSDSNRNSNSEVITPDVPSRGVARRDEQIHIQRDQLQV